MRDDELRRDVTAELSWDPQVDSDAIEVSVANGTVALRGTAASLWLKQAAGRGAARVRGVTRVANELRVEIPGKDRRDDEDLRGDVLEALMLDVSVPMTLDAQARDGFVTLTGTAQWHYQREAAEFRTANVPGVAGIDNAITLTQTPSAGSGPATPPSAGSGPATPPSAGSGPTTPPSAGSDPTTPPSAGSDPATPPSARDAREAISAAFRRVAVLELNRLWVDTCADGLVILSGMVSSWTARDHAVAAAWSAPGVTRVEDRIRVESRP